MRELTVILDANGNITAAQVRNEKGEARGLALADLPPSLALINEAALLSVADLVALNAGHEAATTALNTEHEATLKVQADALLALQAELDAYKAQGVQAAQAVVAVVDNPAVNDAQTAVVCKQIALEILKNKLERDIEAADKAAADAVAYAAALRAA